MAAWRKRAYATFGLPAGSYSHAEGKKNLLSDLVDWSRDALRDNDFKRVQEIRDYVVWADRQRSETLDSVIDLVFFAPVFEDEMLRAQLLPLFPSDLVARMQKRLCTH